MSDEQPSVSIRLPSFLKVMVGTDRVRVRAGCVAEALEAAYAATPALRHHLAQDSGELRPHVLCLLNGEHVPRDALATTVLTEGDEIAIWQAITGG